VTISYQDHIYALDRLLARASIAPCQAPAFMEQIDRPKLAENVAWQALMQYPNCTIEFVTSVAPTTVIDEYAVFGPKLDDRIPSFYGVPLSEHLVEIAFEEGLYGIRHSSLAYFRSTIVHLNTSRHERQLASAATSDETDGDRINVHAPSPTRNCTTSAAAQNAGNSQPPPLLLNGQPFLP